MERKTGVVVPVSALYTKDCPASGDFVALKSFADFCEKCGLSVIQLLPVNDTGTHSSPYSCLSANALHPLYIRLESLPEFADAKSSNRAFSAAYKSFKKECAYNRRFNYKKVCEEKINLLHLIYAHLEKRMLLKAKNAGASQGAGQDGLEYLKHIDFEMNEFVSDNPWVVPYAVFKDFKDVYSQASWKDWDEMQRKMTRRQIELRWSNRALRGSLNFYVWCQMRAFQQFKDAADYIRGKGIILKGDVPILMNEDSVECWAWPEFFDQDLRAGSPPDSDNPTGQRWGFPVYDWDRIAEDDFAWWKQRIRCASNYYSAFRLDHVLGFFRLWTYKNSETTAFLGHESPYAYTERRVLEKMGFSEGRIKWLSQPHIPTRLVSDLTGNLDVAHAALEKVAVRIKDEELWTFKDSIKSDSDIFAVDFSDDSGLNLRIREALAKKWLDRTLMEIEKDCFVPVWSYEISTSWKSLSDEEKSLLKNEFAELFEQKNELWKSHANEVLGPIVQASDMQPCAEDLGVDFPAVKEVLPELNIASLRVVRWTRFWSKDGQPYEDFDTYPPLSVCTTSVHDSSTIRQWWQDEKSSVWAFLDAAKKIREKMQISFEDPDVIDGNCDFTPDVARFVLENCALCSSLWYVNPLQDYLYMEEKCWAENAEDERINVPGTVSERNWTLRLPVDLDELLSNGALIDKIKKIVITHDSCGVQSGN